MSRTRRTKFTQWLGMGVMGMATMLGLWQWPTNISVYGADPVFVGAGDIASCSSSGDEATAALLDAIPGTVFTLGDNAYESGTATEFANCYDPSWGRHKARTFPAPGNHDYFTLNASGYFSYFGAAAGDPTKGYYSYDLGTWRIIVINSNCAVVEGCYVGSPQEQWLRADLAAHPTACTLAYWHHPRFSSGSTHGSSTEMQPIWQALYEAGADVVLSGHEHNYERFAPQDPNGNLDTVHGIREFVVGTGGASHYAFGTMLPNTEVRNSDTYGVLKLTLHPGSYDWQFVPEAGKTFTDSGSALCVASGTSALFRVDRQTGSVYADGAYSCGLASGCFNAGTGADLAEYIRVSEIIEPGDLVEAHPDRPHVYRKTQEAYSVRVAGVSSLRPGMALAQRAFQGTPALLALAGRVPVKATTENGPIRPGDLLVSSSRPGYAMRCADLTLCEGAIFGKALDVLEIAEGLISVLVMSH